MLHGARAKRPSRLDGLREILCRGVPTLDLLGSQGSLRRKWRACSVFDVIEMTDTIRSSLVLPPLIASPQTAPRQGESVPVVLDSFQHKYQQRNTASEGHAIGPHTQALPVGASMVSPGASPFGHSPASLGASPAAMPPALLGSSLRPRGKSPERSSEEDPKMHMKVETNSPNGDDIITLFPRRKAGQTRPGGGRGPVVLNLELLEKFYGMPLHVAANRLVGDISCVCMMHVLAS